MAPALQAGGSREVEKSQGVFQKQRSLSRVLRKGKTTRANKEFISSYYKERQGRGRMSGMAGSKAQSS